MVYVIEGGTDEPAKRQAGIYSNGNVNLIAGRNGFSALVLAGQPLDEPVDALVRELGEELFIQPRELAEIGDYFYKGSMHKIFGADFAAHIEKFDHAEIRRVGWQSLDEVRDFERRGRLHAGFELSAMLDFPGKQGLESN